MKIAFLLVVTTFFLPASARAQATPREERVGIVDDPCKALPSHPSASGEKEMEEWQRKLLLADFFSLCRYRSENQSLSPYSSGRIIFMGDSITQGWKESRPEFFGANRINRGISGQTSAQMLGRFYADVIALRPFAVHILAGANDIAGNGGPTTLQNIENNIKTMVEIARAHRIRIILGTILPAARYGWRPEIEPIPQIAVLNSWIKSYARKNGLGLVDYYAALDDGRHGLSRTDSDDGVHPSPQGYAKMERAFSAEASPSRAMKRPRSKFDRSAKLRSSQSDRWMPHQG